MLSRIRDRLSDFTRSQLGRSSVRDSLENPDKTPQNVASDVVLFRGQNRLNVLSCRELRPSDSGLPARLLISGSLARVPRRFHDLRSEIRCQFVPPCDELTLAEEELRANSWVEAVSSRKLSEERDVPALVVHLGFEARPVVGSPCAVRVGLIDVTSNNRLRRVGPTRKILAARSSLQVASRHRFAYHRNEPLG
jgi:hypothetical protein